MTDAQAIAGGLSARDIQCLKYHSMPDRKASSGSLADDMSCLLQGFLDFGKDGRLLLTESGRAILAKEEK